MLTTPPWFKIRSSRTSASKLRTRASSRSAKTIRPPGALPPTHPSSRTRISRTSAPTSKCQSTCTASRRARTSSECISAISPCKEKQSRVKRTRTPVGASILSSPTSFSSPESRFPFLELHEHEDATSISNSPRLCRVSRTVRGCSRPRGFADPSQRLGREGRSELPQDVHLRAGQGGHEAANLGFGALVRLDRHGSDGQHHQDQGCG